MTNAASSGGDVGASRERAERRALCAALYRPETVRLAILGEAPPPERFFYFADSLFFRYLRQAFVRALPLVDAHGPDWFLALFREIGGWREDVCNAPRRATKGGADDVSDCLEAFLTRWRAIDHAQDRVLIVSPKRLFSALPDEVRREVTASVPPPGQWNAHRQAFLRDTAGVLERYIGRGALTDAAARIDADDARLDFDIVRACVRDGDDEIERLLRGHPREEALRRAWKGAGE